MLFLGSSVLFVFVIKKKNIRKMLFFKDCVIIYPPLIYFFLAIVITFGPSVGASVQAKI